MNLQFAAPSDFKELETLDLKTDSSLPREYLEFLSKGSNASALIPVDPYEVFLYSAQEVIRRLNDGILPTGLVEIGRGYNNSLSRTRRISDEVVIFLETQATSARVSLIEVWLIGKRRILYPSMEAFLIASDFTEFRQMLEQPYEQLDDTDATTPQLVTLLQS